MSLCTSVDHRFTIKHRREPEDAGIDALNHRELIFDVDLFPQLFDRLNRDCKKRCLHPSPPLLPMTCQACNDALVRAGPFPTRKSLISRCACSLLPVPFKATDKVLPRVVFIANDIGMKHFSARHQGRTIRFQPIFFIKKIRAQN